MDLKLLKMLCKDNKQHHVMFHKLDSDSSLLCIAQNVRFEIPYKVLYFETPFLMIFKYYAWVSYDDTSQIQDLETDVLDMTAESLNFWLTKFIMEVCKDTGENYYILLVRCTALFLLYKMLPSLVFFI